MQTVCRSPQSYHRIEAVLWGYVIHEVFAIEEFPLWFFFGEVTIDWRRKNERWDIPGWQSCEVTLALLYGPYFEDCALLTRTRIVHSQCCSDHCKYHQLWPNSGRFRLILHPLLLQDMHSTGNNLEPLSPLTGNWEYEWSWQSIGLCGYHLLFLQERWSIHCFQIYNELVFHHVIRVTCYEIVDGLILMYSEGKREGSFLAIHYSTLLYIDFSEREMSVKR